MIIKYDMRGSWCLTGCKHYQHFSQQPKVGSLFCQSCDYNKNYDQENQTVECIYPEKVEVLS